MKFEVEVNYNPQAFAVNVERCGVIVVPEIVRAFPVSGGEGMVTREFWPIILETSVPLKRMKDFLLTVDRDRPLRAVTAIELAAFGAENPEFQCAQSVWALGQSSWSKDGNERFLMLGVRQKKRTAVLSSFFANEPVVGKGHCVLAVAA